MKVHAASFRILATSLISLVPFTGCRRAADRPRIDPRVRMQDVTFHSAALNRNMPYRVFLPMNIAPGQRLPVVYLLHGGQGGEYRDWSNYTDVSRYAARGLILVMPEGGFSYYMNEAMKPGDRYEDYTFTDLIADVESRFPVAADRDHRAVIGISMGGFAAIKIALTRPDLFVFVGSFSPSIEITHRRFHIMRIEEWFRIQRIFGPWGSDTRNARDPFALVATADPTKVPFIYLTSGENESLFDPDRDFASLLYEHHYAYEFHTRPGRHAWSQWDAQVPGCFESLLQHLKPMP